MENELNQETKDFISMLLAENCSDKVLSELLELKRKDWEAIVLEAQNWKAGDSDIPDSFGTHQYHDIG